MLFSRRRSIRGLLASWAIYWVVIAVVKLGPAAAAIWHATHVKDADQASVGMSFTNVVFNLTVGEYGKTTYAGSAHLATIALWIAGPPLLLWLRWVLTRPAAEPASEQARVS